MGLYFNTRCQSCGELFNWVSFQPQLCFSCQMNSSVVDLEKTRSISFNITADQESRPSFQSIYMSLAESLAERSTCNRLKVGTVITSTDFRKVLAVGYNGNASGLPNECDSHEKEKCGCLHSEDNSVINCDSPRSVEKYVFVTHLPCVMCTKRLINLGNVKKVFYRNDYRIRDGIELFKTVGIDVEKI